MSSNDTAVVPKKKDKFGSLLSQVNLIDPSSSSASLSSPSTFAQAQTQAQAQAAPATITTTAPPAGGSLFDRVSFAPSATSPSALQQQQACFVQRAHKYLSDYQRWRAMMDESWQQLYHRREYECQQAELLRQQQQLQQAAVAAVSVVLPPGAYQRTWLFARLNDLDFAECWVAVVSGDDSYSPKEMDWEPIP
jgi:hypothetical protein